jgi:hypothetical protein
MAGDQMYPFNLLFIEEWQILGLVCLCYLVMLAHFIKRGKLSLDDPVFLLALVFTFGVTIKVLYIIFVRPDDVVKDMGLARDRMLMGKNIIFLVHGMIYIFMSVLAYVVFLNTKLSIPLDRTGAFINKINEKAFFRLCLALTFIFVVAIIYYVIKQGILDGGYLFDKRFNNIEGGATQRFFFVDYWIFKLSSSVKYIFYAILIFWISKKENISWRWWVLFVATFALTILIPAIFGNRANTFVICLDLILLLAVGPSIRRVVTVAMFLCVAAGVLAITTVDRYSATIALNERVAKAEKSDEVREAQILSERIQNSKAPPPPVEVKAKFGPPSVTDVTKPQNKQFMKDRHEWKSWLAASAGYPAARTLEHLLQGRYFLDLLKTSHIVDEFPVRLSFLHGESFVGWVFVLVPSSVWEGKPVFAGLPRLLAAKIFAEPSNNVPPGIVAETYLNFGWWGGIVAMALIGLATGTIFNTFQHNRASPLAQVVYAALMTRLVIIMFNTSFGDAILKSLIDLVPVVLLLWLASSPRAEQALPASGA